MKMAAQATAQAEAEAATQGDESVVAVNEARCVNGGSTEDQSHNAKKQAVGNGSGWNYKSIGLPRVEDRATFASFG